MSSLSGRFREVVAYKILPHQHKVIGETYPCCKCLLILRKNPPVFPIEKFPSLVLSGNAIMLQHRIIQFSFNYLSTGRLQEVKNKRKFHIFCAKSGHGLLREVDSYKRFQIIMI